jgi:hypothetical protein
MLRTFLCFGSLCGALFVVGCTTVSSRYVPTVVAISEPPLNSVNIAQIGDNLLRQGTFSEHDAIYVKSDIDVGTFDGYTIRPGFYVKGGENEDSNFFTPSTYGNGGSVVRNPLVDPWKWIRAYKDRNTICIVTVFNVSVCADNVPFERARQPVATPNSFQQTLIYSGKLGNKLKIGYREFSGNLARPAFNNNVEYDLNESNHIGYKGARIEVLEATNEHIKYKVLKNFNAAGQ